MGNLCYTYEFARIVFGQALLTTSSFQDTVCRVASKVSETGSELALMLQVDKIWCEKMLEDVFFCPFANNLRTRLLDEAYHNEELTNWLPGIWLA
eukprot:1740264-Heterocapsa_arctica.AAC.1